MSNPKILCAAYGGGHVNACLPVAQALNARGWNVHFLALTTAYDPVIRAGAIGAGVCVWQARDLIGSADADTLEHGERLVDDARPHGSVSREESVAYHGLGYHDLASSYGEQRAASLYSERGRAAFEHTALANRIIDAVAPDIVLTSNSPRAEKAVIDGAKARGIPAVVLNDTLVSASNHWLHRADYADRILVLNEAVKRVLIASGHAPDKSPSPAIQRLSKWLGLRIGAAFSRPRAAKRARPCSTPRSYWPAKTLSTKKPPTIIRIRIGAAAMATRNRPEPGYCLAPRSEHRRKVVR